MKSPGIHEQGFLQRRPDAVSWLVVCCHIAFVFAPVYLAATLPLGPHVVLLWLWFGFTQNGLINLLHECAHELTFRRRPAARWLGTWLLAPLVLTDFQGYRERHWQHHRELGTVHDLKLVYRVDIHGTRVLRFLASCLVGYEGVRLLRSSGASGERSSPALQSLARVAVVHACLLASLVTVAWLSHRELASTLLASAVAYGLVYGYGLASLTVFAAGLRAIAEHQIGPDAPESVGEAALRNFRSQPLSRLLMGAYGFAEHATHHREPAIPYYHLPAATLELAQAEPRLAPRKGYFETLAMLISGPGASAPGAREPSSETQQ
ncbi:MAG TPA: fatty acid desaturase [Polyangiaceae bacterium]|nr:fatty acid desaturase [Polyangiaceae bacterium]